MKKNLKKVGSNLFKSLLICNNKHHLILSAFLFILSIFLSSCNTTSKVKYEDASRYGKLRFSRTTQVKKFSFITTEEFNQSDKSKKDIAQRGLTLKEVSLVTNLLKQQDYCIQKDEKTKEILDEEPYFLITRKQPAAYQVLPEINYQRAAGDMGNGNKIMVVPATFYGQCISKEDYFKIQEKRAEKYKDFKKKKKEEQKNKKKGKETKNNQDSKSNQKNNEELSKEQIKLMKLQEKNRKKALKNSKNKQKMTRKKFESQMKNYKKIMKKEGKENSKDSNILLLF